MKPQKPKLPQSLGIYLAMCFSLLSVLLTLILLVVIDVTVTKQAKASIGSNLAVLAHQISDRLDQAMFERSREIRLISARITRIESPVDSPESRLILNTIQRSYPHYAWIGLTDEQGKVLVATNAVLENADVSARPWFQSSTSGVHVSDVHEAELLANLLPNSTGEPLRFVDISTPYASRDGKNKGVLGVHLSWAWARDVQRSIMEPVDGARKLDAMILSADDKVLLGPPGLQGQTLDLDKLKKLKLGDYDFNTERLPDGHDYLVGVSRGTGHATYPGLGWKVLVTERIEDAYLPVKQLQVQVFWIGLSVASVFSLLGWWVARIVTRPLKRLSRSAQQLEAGEPVKIDVIDGAYAEVNALSGSLNSLIGNLTHKEADLTDLNVTLENRVERRTAELTQALASVRHNENRIKTIIETAQGAFIGVNFEGRITDWNSQAEKMLGWRREEILGESLDLLIPDRFKSNISEALKAFSSTGAANFINNQMERLVLTKDSKELLVELRVGLINTADLKFFSAFLHDISERKQLERIKSEFIATASHELRTPLTSIYGALGLVNAGMAGDLPPTAKELIGISYKSAERLVRLVNDILDVEKLESRSMTYNKVIQPLLPLLEQSVAATQTYAEPYQVRFELICESGEDAQVCVDADRVTQVVVNLLSNAAKFSRAGGATVTVRLLQPVPGMVRVSVADSGCGIPESFHGRIFERFAQADASDQRQKGGTGLGLSICKSIIEAHQGKIGFVSAPGKGSTFYFDLPLIMQS